MTQLTITPKIADKTARFSGTVAAGEHVAVTIKGGAEWLGEDEGANLTLRVLDMVTGRTLAVFPQPVEESDGTETEEAETEQSGTGEESGSESESEEETIDPNAWRAADADAADLYCELNLNTTRMVAAARHMIRVPVLFVLGDTDNPRTLYFRDRHEVEYWPERIGDTTPYDLDKWPKKIDDWTELIADFTEQLETMSDNINDALEDVETAISETIPAAVENEVEGQLDGKVDKDTDAVAGNFAQFVSGGGIEDSGKSASDFADAGDLADHTGDLDIHVTAAQKTQWTAKAEKASNPTAGNFAGLDQYGNPTDSGKKASDFATADDKANLQQAIGAEIVNRTSSYNSLDSRITILAGDDPSKSMRTVAAEEVAKVVANADTSFDTLKEIADWIQSDTTGAAKMAKDIEDLKSEKADAADLAAVATSGSYSDLSNKPTIPDAQVQSDWSQSDSTKKDFIKNKPTIPAAVSVDATLTQSGAAADAKATGDMLYTGFTPWKADSPLSGYDFESCVWKSSMSKWEVSWKAVMPGGTDRTTLADGAEDDVSITGSSPLAYALSRHRITPTKTSQLENDGDGTSPFAKVSQLPDVSGLATKAELPYPFAEPTLSNGTLTITPRTVATYTADSSAAAFTVAVGTGASGAARDCVLVVDCTDADAVAPTVTWPSNFHPRGDAEEIAPVAGVRNVFYISEYAPGEFVVGGWHEEVA